MKYLLLILTFWTINTYAQTNFIPGKITTNNNEVIEGFINYQDWRKTPETIEFKSGDEIKFLSPENILMFEVEGDRFISRTVIIDVTDQRLQHMDKNTKVKFEERKVFLNVLVIGNLSLYEFSDIRNHYFYGKDGEIKELIYREYFADNNIDLIKLKKYIGQFRVLMNDCDASKPSDNLNYKRKDLVKAVNKYNLCKDPNKTDYIKTDNGKNKNKLYVTAGYYFSNFKLEGKTARLIHFEGGSLSTPSIGIAYEISMSRKLGRSSLYTELVYNKYSQSYSNDEPSSSVTLYNPFVLEFSTINISSFFRYKFVKQNQKVIPFMNIGLGYNIIFSENSTITKINTFNSNTTLISVPLNSGYFNFSIGAGVNYNRFNLELRYFLTDKIISVSSENNSISNFGLMLSYSLLKS